MPVIVVDKTWSCPRTPWPCSGTKFGARTARMPHNAFPLSPPNTGTCRPSISYVLCCLPSARPDHFLPLSRRTSLLRSARWSEYPNCCIAYFLGTSSHPPWAITASYNAYISHRTTKIHQPPDQNARRRAAHTLRTAPRTSSIHNKRANKCASAPADRKPSRRTVTAQKRSQRHAKAGFRTLSKERPEALQTEYDVSRHFMSNLPKHFYGLITRI